MAKRISENNSGKAGSKKKEEKSSKIKVVFTGETLFSNKKDAFTLYEKSRFGEAKEGKIFYSLFEALYLLERGKIDVVEGKKKLNFEKFIEKLKELDKRIQIKYIVFKDMRDRGYTIKTALKFGAEFRVYDKGKKPGEEHARWILYPVRESDMLTWHEFAAKNRVAHSTKKNLLIGIVDEENDTTYYEIRWVKP
ncbi:tRNA-intron lyase [Candidatus Pacearchaeota archaeon]|nr:tRNA-intron lyase [Candidatus Pacearchaeota archaeon]